MWRKENESNKIHRVVSSGNRRYHPVSGFVVEVKKGGDTMETYTNIKCGLRARIEGLEIMLDMYEKKITHCATT